MPVKVNIGLSKKVGLPDYGSLGARISPDLRRWHNDRLGLEQQQPHLVSVPSVRRRGEAFFLAIKRSAIRNAAMREES